MTEGTRPAAPLWMQDQWDAAEASVAARATRWRAIGFLLAATVWAVPSMFVGFFGFVALTGWSGDGTSADTVFDGVFDGGGSGLVVLTFAILLEVAAGAALVAIARWAWGRRPGAVVSGLVATVWAQFLVGISLMV